MKYIIPIITASFALGIWCGGAYFWLLPVLYVSGLMLILLVLWQVFVHKSVIWSLGILFFVLGMIRFFHDDGISPTDVSLYVGQTLVVQGIICEVPQVALVDDGKSKVRYIVETKTGYTLGGKKLPLTGKFPISLRQAGGKEIFDFGDEIKATGEIAALHGYNNPAQYDSVAAAKRQGIRARMSSQENGVHRIRSNQQGSWQQTFAVWREKIIKNMQQVMPEYHAALLSGMLFGGYGGVPPEIVADFATTGIVHILSVSGSHIALVVGVITALGIVITRTISLPPQVVPLFAASIVTFYALFCGLTPPVLRSLVMGLIALVAVCFEREKDGGHALLLSALGMMIHQPALLYDLSFQLSFASTAGLVFLNPRTKEILLTRLPAWLATVSAVTISAQLGVFPFIAWYFNSFSLSSLLANAVIVPMIEGVVVLGLSGAMAGLVMPVVGKIIMVVCSLVIGIVVQCNQWLAAVPYAKIYIPAVGMVGGVVYYIFLAWVYGYKPENVLSLTELVKKWPRCSGGFLILMVSGIMIYQVYPRPVRIHFIDVGQGDATLIVTPHGRGILVDTGGVIGDANGFDVGQRVIAPYLTHYGVLSIDYLFLTHGHADHAGGAAGVARIIPVQRGMLPQEEASQAVSDFLRAAPKSNIIPVNERQIIELDGVVIRIIYAPSSASTKQNNEVSTVLQVRYGQHSFLLTGDLEAKGEEAILASGKDISSTVLKVGHHGAKTSSSLGFLEKVAPKYAVISVGANNRFGHPHGDTIERLQGQPSKIYRTDQQGAIIFTTDGQRLSVETFIRS